MNDLHLRFPRPVPAQEGQFPKPIGQLLLDSGKIGAEDLSHALKLQQRIDAPLGDIMVAEGLVQKNDVQNALAKQARTRRSDLDLEPPPLELADRLPAWLCLRHGVVPWREEGGTLYVATGSPHDFTRLRTALGPRATGLFPVIVDDAQIKKHINRLYGTELALAAATRVAAHESCRDWEDGAVVRNRIIFAALACCATFALFFPAAFISALAILASLTLLMTTGLKLVALFAHVTRGLPPIPRYLQFLRERLVRKRLAKELPELGVIPAPRAAAALRIVGAVQSFSAIGLPTFNNSDQFRMTRVSVLVPLLREREIAGQLINRLSRLTYPKSLLEIVLVLEASDTVTRETISRTDLPDWMRVIEVPDTGVLTTKPRALNYALDFCKGSIIGVWDAEDWPEPGQLEQIVARFHAAPREVACLQGVLDYYNSRSNWLTRCFAIEYATWWRVFLPGIARVGLVVPLGGTTLFFRREALDRLGGWDAHNVTEDADLGLRLARHGYRTELVSTTTHEEATSRAWPWVRQRSRWLKGFLMTYFVHMRDVPALWRDLGPARFFGIQALFFATVFQFALAPVLWSFWVILLGLGHPSVDILGKGTVGLIIALFIFSAVLSFAAGLVATSRQSHRHLIAFLPTMGVYFTLATVAAYKALWEILRAPYFWDKTQHGVSRQTDPGPKFAAV